MVLVTDGESSFLLFYYGDLQWGSAGRFIGILSHGMPYFIVESVYLSFQNIETTSNVGFPGLYIARVDQEDILVPSFTGSYYYLSVNILPKTRTTISLDKLIESFNNILALCYVFFKL